MPLSFAEWLLFAATGRVLIYLWMQFPEPPFMKLPYWLEKLHRCDLCSGFYIYSVLAIALNIDLFGIENIITQVTTGAITTYLAHVFVIGWKEKFQPPVII
jgi:hypothetical protein